MTIQYCSDLHLEFPENEKYIMENPIVKKGNRLVLAGDIVPFHLIDSYDWFFEDLSRKFDEVYWLPGNHEYYHAEINLKDFVVSKKIKKNVNIVNNVSWAQGEIVMLFTTLWTRISSLSERHIVNSLNDFRLITSDGKKLDATMYNEFHKASLLFLEITLKEYYDYEIAVFTHHVPTFMHYPRQYKGDPLNEAFAVEMFDFIADSNIKYWVYGHHHSYVKPYKIGNTTMLTNQLGYVSNNEHRNFSTAKTFKL